MSLTNDLFDAKCWTYLEILVRTSDLTMNAVQSRIVMMMNGALADYRAMTCRVNGCPDVTRWSWRPDNNWLQSTKFIKL